VQHISQSLWVSEAEFTSNLRKLLECSDLPAVQGVTGPGRSGAIAAVYASHILTVPFIPFGHYDLPLSPILIVDTARFSGKTLRRAERKYEHLNPVVRWVYEEPPRVRFWYEHWGNPERKDW
jgi:hypothetical protein